MIRVVIADDHAVVRAGLAQLLATFAGVELVGAAENGEEAVSLCAERKPDVVLMDLEMPVLDGIESTRRIKAAQPEVAVVVLTSFSDRERILRALDAGAAGYLLKDAEPDELARAIEAAARGEAPTRPEGRARAPERAPGFDAGRSALRAGARSPRDGRRRAPEQGDRAAARNQREDGEGSSDERLQADRRDGSHAGGSLGPAPWGHAARVLGPMSDCADPAVPGTIGP